MIRNFFSVAGLLSFFGLVFLVVFGIISLIVAFPVAAIAFFFTLLFFSRT